MGSIQRIGVIGVLAAMVVAIGSATAGFATAGPYPVVTDAGVAVTTGLQQPGSVSPAGANRPGCHDSRHRNPVVLIHATVLNQQANWAYLAPTLANAGYCVYSLTYGKTTWSGNLAALAPTARSVRQVGEFVERVLASTGARKVDLIGHSQGGAIAHRVTLLPGLTDRIGTVVGVAAPDATNLGYLETLTGRLPAARAGWNLPSTVHFVNLVTLLDKVVSPPETSLMPPAPNVTNIRVQDVCPRSIVGHVGMAYSPTVAALIRNHLDPAQRVPVPCGSDFPS
ncbi:alpha/beta fold hydrolase [Gordonia sp. ABSL1-1]|uniref:esterase/lipase family protein n=1 Tax=Gordonia sp. ABSL1-1 TaxID=3053923 RepID=UPI002574452A|nr:alpha/beta fold hydrolase [Gordonia sp. ABSL1-1]MDL9938159.1 alpha/beta fold hydrolase [Gordonia sp. ABSL1-1]